MLESNIAYRTSRFTNLLQDKTDPDGLELFCSIDRSVQKSKPSCCFVCNVVELVIGMDVEIFTSCRDRVRP